MSLYDAFTADPKLETEGRWIDVRPANSDGSLPGFLLARRSSRNIPFVKAVQKISAARGDDIRDGTIDPAESSEINVVMFVDTVLKNWRNVPNKNGGGTQTFTRENAVKLMTDLPDLFARLLAESGRLSNYQDAAAETDGKN